jgi:acetyltransferase-like isoleucine patch superfamily enzyme
MLAYRIINKIAHAFTEKLLPIYYRIKISILKKIIGDEAISYVLYDCLVPAVVLKMYGCKIGTNVRIGRWLTIHETHENFSKLTIGNNVHIGKHVMLDISEQIIIEDNVTIAMGVKVLTHVNFGDSELKTFYPSSQGKVVIKKSAYIGANAVILSSLCIILKNMPYMQAYQQSTLNLFL